MIIERENVMKPNQIRADLKKLGSTITLNNITAIMGMFQLYHAASNEFATKLENLDSEFQTRFDYNPIHHMESRMKAAPSLLKKMQDKGLDFSVQAVHDHIYDVAGIRVITNYVDDIYSVADNLIKQDDVTLIRKKDYVQHPKASGYRSLHLIVSVPVFQTDGAHETPVEIQIRTIGMDMWASLEHKLRYKTNADPEQVERYGGRLADYANQLATIEENMREIHRQIR